MAASDPLFAQTAASTPGIHIGALTLTPSIAITDAGVDSNVYSTAENPVRDYLVRVAPALNYLLPVRRLDVRAKSTVGYTYYRKAVDRRTVDVMHDGRLDVKSEIFSPHLYGTYGHTSGRPNPEIDTWVRQLNRRFGAGADIQIGSRLRLTLDADRSVPDFKDQRFRGADLEALLNRRTDAVHATAHMVLTPFTTFVLSGDESRDRFEFSKIRDTETATVLAGVELNPSALIQGSASVGYRRSHALDPSVPDFKGVVANVGVSTVLRGRTRLALNGTRTTEYSADAIRPYYVLTGGRFVVTLPIGSAWDVNGGIGRDRLDYRSLSVVPDEAVVSRVDTVSTATAGLGRRLGEGARIGLNVAYATRRSPLTANSYDGWRAGMSFSYGS